MKLQGKVFIITGCSAGIGIETAQVLSATGTKLYLTARNLPKGVDALAGKPDLAASSSSRWTSIRSPASAPAPGHS